MESGVPLCSTCGEPVGFSSNGEVFVACHECNYPLCKPCFEDELKEGRGSCLRCGASYLVHGMLSWFPSSLLGFLCSWYVWWNHSEGFTLVLRFIVWYWIWLFCLVWNLQTLLKMLIIKNCENESRWRHIYRTVRLMLLFNMLANVCCLYWCFSCFMIEFLWHVIRLGNKLISNFLICFVLQEGCLVFLAG